MDKKSANVLHGNHAKITNDITPTYQTITSTGKCTSNVHSKVPVNPISEQNVIQSKKFVDENHK